jgi:outer membrane immunogenic protein
MAGVANAAPPAVPTWQGYYVGATIGVARDDASCTQVAPSYGYYGSCTSYYGSASNVASATGLTAGGEIGYDWQRGSFVFGAVADDQWTNLRNAQNTYVYSSFQIATTSLVSLRGRLGMDVADTMIYLTGGAAFAHINDTTPYYAGGNYGSLDATKVGWVAGMGIEHKFAGTPWSVKAEILYYDLGFKNGQGVADGETYVSQFSNSIVQGKLGVDLHF